MKTFKTCKTKKRTWNELVRCINYHDRINIGNDLYLEIMEVIKKEKTDGVIIDYKLGTIANNQYFVSFIYSELTKTEKNIYDKLKEEKELKKYRKYLKK